MFAEENVSLPREISAYPSQTSPKMTTKEARKLRLEIINPFPGGQETISLLYALRYQAQGRAHIDEQHRVTFLDHTDVRQICAEQNLLMRTRYGYDRETHGGMIATKIELAGIPVVCADVLLGRGKCSRTPMRPHPVTLEQM